MSKVFRQTTNQQASNQQLNQSIVSLNKAVYQGNERRLTVDTVLVEQPLQITLAWQENDIQRSVIFSITMRTPGHDKLLILGLLMAEGVIKHRDDFISIAAESNTDEQQLNNYQNLWLVKLAEGITPRISSLEQYQFRYSSCGLCGTTSLKSLELKAPPKLNKDSHWLTTEHIKSMPSLMRNSQILFNETGGSHAAALFDNKCQLLDVQEDIGRHNALDKLVGALVINGHFRDKNERHCIVMSSRISFEIVQKTVMAGIPVLIAVGAPSDLAIVAAKRFDLTLIGFVSNKSFNVYHGDWRLLNR